jgi:4-amino-4-deoxy-L-arabinose transferase-like glycosyltransferase
MLRPAPRRQAALLTLACALSIAATTRWHAPPRFDGAGYALLARSLSEGHGYRQIEHPDQPPHTHYPPGYPLALAVLWHLTGGPSALSAHALSAFCTTGAVLLTWLWFRRLVPDRPAFLLALALALNWLWARDAAVIRSEPLFQLLTAASVLLADTLARSGRVGPALALGLTLGAAVLTRHVGAMLALACLLHLLLARRWRPAALTAVVAVAVVAPWAYRLLTTPRPTQLDLIGPERGLSLLAAQSLFYLRRMPDLLTGPFVEVGTVFRPWLTVPMTAWAALASAMILAGWLRMLKNPSRRLASLVPLATLPLLLVWPFTEAGRFLIPLLPFLLLGATEGVAAILTRVCRPLAPRATTLAASLVLAAGLPYAAYAAASDRAGAEARIQAGFDSACAWIAAHADRPGPLLTRYPGDAFWLTGRQALAPDPSTPIDAQIDRYAIAYILIEGQRFARADADPLAAYVADHPSRVHLLWRSPLGASVYEVRNP